MLDAVSSTRSLALSPAVSRGNDSYSTNRPSASMVTVVRNRVRVPHLLAGATIRGRRLFCSKASDCAATIRGQCVFEEIRYFSDDKDWIYYLYEEYKHRYTLSIGSISNLYHVETVNYNSIQCKLFRYNM